MSYLIYIIFVLLTVWSFIHEERRDNNHHDKKD